MQHAFHLIRQKLRFQEVETGSSGIELGHELLARGGSGRRALRPFDPQRKMP